MCAGAKWGREANQTPASDRLGYALVMSHAKAFDRELDDLWHRRTAPIRAHVRRRPGAPKSLTKKGRENAIAALCRLAEQVICRRDARRELESIVRRSRRTVLRGRGLEARFGNIKTWAQKHLKGPIIYSFWRGNRCLYVGKGKSWRRLGAYQKSVYLRDASTLRVKMVRSPSYLPKAECLCTHLYEPRDNRAKAASKTYPQKCPICRATKQIRDEIRELFRMR